jgi:hypothetical protein
MPARAFCPVCVVAVGGGLEISRWLGVDDTITGLWAGGLLVALIVWTLDWMKKKNYNFKQDAVAVVLLYYVLTIAPLYWYHVIGSPFNKIWGIDKLTAGIIVGSIVFQGGSTLHSFLRKKNNNKSFFKMQKTIIPVAALLIASGVMYFITKI